MGGINGTYKGSYHQNSLLSASLHLLFHCSPEGDASIDGNTTCHLFPTGPFAVIPRIIFGAIGILRCASNSFLFNLLLSLSYKSFAFFITGYRIHAGSASPVRRRDAYHRYTSDFDHSGGLTRGRGFGGGRDLRRYQDSLPHYGRRATRSRPFGRAFDGPGFAPGPFRGERMSNNNPNVRPRDGDWYCPDPLCDNLNFARREFCNNCNRPRPGVGGSPRRGYVDSPPVYSPPRRFAAHPIDRSPGRTLNDYRSPPRGWARDGPREIAAGGLPPPRYESRFPDHQLRRERVDYLEESFRGRSKFDRPIPADWDLRDNNGRDGFLSGRKGFERRPPSPPQPLLPQRDRWARDVRERSRSPVRGPVLSPMRVSLRSPLGGDLPPKDFRRDIYVERDRRGLVRDRNGGLF